MNVLEALRIQCVTCSGAARERQRRPVAAMLQKKASCNYPTKCHCLEPCLHVNGGLHPSRHPLCLDGGLHLNGVHYCRQHPAKVKVDDSARV